MRGSQERFQKGVLEGVRAVNVAHLAPKGLEDYLKGKVFLRGRLVNADGSVSTVYKLDTSESKYGDVKIVANASGDLDIYVNGAHHRAFSDVEQASEYISNKMFWTVFDESKEESKEE